MAHSELIQVTDLLTLFAGVASTPLASGPTWSTLINIPSSATELVVSQLATTLVGTQRLCHALGGSAAPSIHMSTASAVIAPVPEPPGHGLSGEDIDDLYDIHEDLDDSLMLEGSDVQDLSCASLHDEPANNTRKRTNKKRPRTNKHAHKLAMATALLCCAGCGREPRAAVLVLLGPSLRRWSRALNYPTSKPIANRI